MEAKKLTQEEWKEIEFECGEIELRIIKLMLDASSLHHASSITQEQQKIRLEVLGESIYQELIHKKLMKHFFSEEEEEKSKSGKKDKKEKKEVKNEKSKGKKGQKKGKNDIYEKFMKSEKKKKIEDLLTDQLKASQDSLFKQKNFGFSSNVLEFKLISFLVLGKIVKDKEEWMYEIIIGLRKCLASYENYKGKLHYNEPNQEITEDIVSETLIKLIKKFLDSSIEMNIFSMRIAFVRYPKLIYHTNFDPYFENIRLKPYISQKEILKSLRNYYKIKENKLKNPQGLLVFYKAMIGSGKTTVALALAAMVKNLRQEFPKEYGSLQVIFCCGLAQIRIQVGQLLFNALEFEKISFAVVSSYENQIVTKNHFSCLKTKNPIFLITDLETTELLLKENETISNQSPNRYLLFLDEPIIDADQNECPLTKRFISLMKNPPDFTILSSATLPNPEQIPSLVRLFREKYPQSEIMTVLSDQAKIGQQIYLNFEEKYYPHNECKTKEDLALVLKAIKSSPFLAKLYTGSSLYYFEEKVIKMNLVKLLGQGIEAKFYEPSNSPQKLVQETVFDLLESLLHHCNDAQISEFCLPEQEILIENSAFKWKHLATKNAHVFTGGCLIATPQALEFARKTFGPYVGKVNFKTLVKEYLKNKEIFEVGLAKFDDIKNEEVQLKEKTKYINENTPKLQFPNHMKINLKEHLLKYNGLKKPELVGYRKDFLLEECIFKIDEDLNLMLFSGVGVFESEKILNEEYNQTIRNKAKYGELAYLISHKDILYGANYPLNNVIVKDSFAENFSVSTIFQTMGRAGRIGQAWKSNCFIGTQTKKKVTEYIKNEVLGLFLSEEVKNIESLCFQQLEKKYSPINETEKIQIYYDENSLESILASAICVAYYLQKYQKKKGKSFSDLDFFEYVQIIPMDCLQSLENSSGVNKVRILNSNPLREVKLKTNKLLCCGDFPKIDEKFEIKLKKLIKIEEKKGFLMSSFDYYYKKVRKNDLGLYILMPSYVRKEYNQKIEWTVLAKTVEIYLKEKKAKPFFIEKISEFYNLYGFCMKTLYKIMFLGRKFKEDAKLNEKFVKKCELLVQQHLKILVFKNQKYLVLVEIALKYLERKQYLFEIITKKAHEMKLSPGCLIIWGSYRNREEIMVENLLPTGVESPFGVGVVTVAKEKFKSLELLEINDF